MRKVDWAGYLHRVVLFVSEETLLVVLLEEIHLIVLSLVECYLKMILDGINE